MYQQRWFFIIVYFVVSGYCQGIRVGVNQCNGGNKVEDEEVLYGGGAEWQSGSGFNDGVCYIVLFDQIWNVDDVFIY